MHTFFSSLRGGPKRIGTGSGSGSGSGGGYGHGNGVCDSPPPWALMHGTVFPGMGARGESWKRDRAQEARAAAVACYCCHPCTRWIHSVTSLGESDGRARRVLAAPVSGWERV